MKVSPNAAFSVEMERKSILLVEDDALVRDVLKDALERKYYVSEASSYSEAMDQLGNHIDLAIIDYVLQDGDGFEVLNEIRKIKSELPAIIITGFSEEDVVIRALRAGVTDYIKKPLSLKYLMKRVSEILEDKGREEGDEYPEGEGVKNRDEFMMDYIATYVRENYMEDLTREKIAGIAYMNRNKFCELFKKRFGQTFTSYLNSIRVKKATELLKTPDLGITEIADHVGYRSVIHFERVFRKVYKLSPREYRKNIKQSD